MSSTGLFIFNFFVFWALIFLGSKVFAKNISFFKAVSLMVGASLLMDMWVLCNYAAGFKAGYEKALQAEHKPATNSQPAEKK